VLKIASQATKWPFPSATKPAPAKNYCLAGLELLDASRIQPLLVVDKECTDIVVVDMATTTKRKRSYCCCCGNMATKTERKGSCW